MGVETGIIRHADIAISAKEGFTKSPFNFDAGKLPFFYVGGRL
jgi:hypothetical protein